MGIPSTIGYYLGNSFVALLALPTPGAVLSPFAVNVMDGIGSQPLPREVKDNAKWREGQKGADQ